MCCVADGKVVDEVNMAQDFERMASRDYTGRQGTLLKLKEMKQIVDNLPPAASVTIASASALVSNLLPHKVIYILMDEAGLPA
jgi:N-acetyl-gamma-glutamyl-phosphate reductase/acetylglutamate kinase